MTVVDGGVVGVGVLGGLEVVVGSARVIVGAPKQRALLGLLVLQAGRVVGSGELIAGLWGQDPPRSAQKTLQTYVSGLRRLLPDGVVITAPGGYQLAVVPAVVDANRFEGLVRAARDARQAGDLEVAAGLLSEGLGLWRGPALMDVLEGAVLEAAAQRLEEVRRAAVEDLGDLRLRLGGHREAIANLEAAVAAEPLRERRWAQLILALYRSGRQADALRTYRRLSDVLGEELGIGPSAELAALEQSVLLQQPDLDWHAPPPSSRTPSPGRSGGPEAMVGLGRDGGLVTLLVADIDNREQRWERDPLTARAAEERLRALLAEVVRAGGGGLLPPAGGQVRAVFASALDAIGAANEMRHRFAAATAATASGGEAEAACRLGLDTGVCEERIGDLVGPAVDRVNQLLWVAHAGQVVVSAVTADLVGEVLPDGVSLRDLGLHRLRDLGRPERVFQVDVAGVDGEFAPLRSLDEPGLLHNLPVQATSFVGRDRELGDVVELLGASRLVTCVGPGGVGKTRLALQAASGLVDGSGGGVWLVELAGVSDPALVAGAVADAMGVRDEPGRGVSEHLVEVLGPKALLILLDNCEHVVEACARLVHVLLRSCAQVHVLATSREPLGVDGERVFRVPSLSVPPEGGVAAGVDPYGFEAVRLFTARAGAHRPGFALDASTVGAVVSICQRVDGIPLAIELAAARLRSLSLAEVEVRLADRFRLLTGGNRAALPRQQTLRALIDWSYDLLSGSERVVLGRLAVFVGGFGLDMAETVTAGDGVDLGDVLDVVTSLADKSLVGVDLSGGDVRYRLSETVRHYALERLAEAGDGEATRHAHAHAFVDLAERAASYLEGPAQLQWLHRLDGEHDNLRVAFAYLHADDALAVDALRLAASLRRYWENRAYYREAVEMLETALSHPGAQADSAARATACASLAHMLIAWGDPRAGQEWGRRGLVIATALNDPSVAASCLVTMSYLSTFGGQPDDGLRVAEDALGFAREAGSDVRLAQAFGARSLAYVYQGDTAAGCADSHTALTLVRQAGNTTQIVTALNNLACMELVLGDLDAAHAHAHEAHELAIEMKFRGELPFTSVTLATLNLLRGTAEAAHGLALDALVLVCQTSDRRVVPVAVLLLALSVSAVGAAERAAFLHGAADAFMIEGNAHDPVESKLRDDDLVHLREVLGDLAFEASYARGNVLRSEDEVVAYMRQQEHL